ncbi:MAG TPA: hypothetical protein PLN12_15085 [Flavobacteriales bacterium]|jgi:hypothetical protein|nr:hypothetical protein [Flavobacteriales bacterium]
MSGLGGFNSGNRSTFLTIGMGLDEKGRPRAVIGRRAQKGDPGAVQVFKSDGTPALTKKDNAEIYRTEFGFVDGIVTWMQRDDSDFGPRLNITIKAGGEQFLLQLDRGNRYWVDFAHRCDNIDFSKPMKLTPYSIPREDNPKKSNQMLVAYQEGTKIEKVKFAEVGPEGTHAPYLDEDEGKWMFGKRDRFLDEGPIQRAIDKVAFLNEAPDTGGQEDEQVPEEALPPVSDEEDQQMPF